MNLPVSSLVVFFGSDTLGRLGDLLEPEEGLGRLSDKGGIAGEVSEGLVTDVAIEVEE